MNFILNIKKNKLEIGLEKSGFYKKPNK
jgi:hypothetical protein